MNYIYSNRVNPDLVIPDIRIPALHFREQICIVGSVTYYCPVYPDLLFRIILILIFNINSIPNKFEGIMDIVDILISKTKIDGSFPDAQFFYNGYSKPHRNDRTLRGGGLPSFL